MFRPDAEAWFEEAKALCRQHGHQALVPLDGVETTPAGIYLANIELIGQADAVLANLDAFRGCEPDSAGTCFEVGFATALGKPIIGYVESDASIVARVADSQDSSLGKTNGHPVDANGWFIEDFGLPLNLMLAVPAPLVVGGLPEALMALGKVSWG